jgi:hypothetical protein
MTVLPAVVDSRRRAPPAGDERQEQWSVVDSALLGCTAALAGAAVVGIADHYYFNIQFPHMAALFWLTAGLALVARRLLVEGHLTTKSR